MPEGATATDAELLDAVLDAFAEHGFAGTSVRDLARRLGVSHNFLPQRFGSKERLWYAAVDHGFDALAREMQRPVDDEVDDLAALRATVVRFIVALGSRPALARILNQEASCPGPRLDHLHERYIAPASRATAHALECLRREQLVRSVPAAAWYFLLTHGAVGPLAMAPLAERFGPVASPDDPDALRAYAEAVADVIIDGIAIRPE